MNIGLSNVSLCACLSEDKFTYMPGYGPQILTPKIIQDLLIFKLFRQQIFFALTLKL